MYTGVWNGRRVRTSTTRIANFMHVISKHLGAGEFLRPDCLIHAHDTLHARRVVFRPIVSIAPHQSED